MANEVKKSKNTQKQSKPKSMVEVVFVNTALEKSNKLLDEITQGNNIFSYSLYEKDTMSIKFEEHKIDQKGRRISDKGELIGQKGKSVISEKMKAEWRKEGKLRKEIDMDEK